MSRAILFGSVACAIGHLAAGTSQAEVFSNPTTIDLPGGGGTFGIGDPYPTAITVAGVVGQIADVNITIHSLTHTHPDDVDILLVGPNGLNVMLMAGAGGSTDLFDVDITFDDEAGAMIPTTAVPPFNVGTFQPSNYEPFQSMASPAPEGPYGNLLSSFDGISPNGVWKLFCADNGSADTGVIRDGWSIEFTMVPAPGALGLMMIPLVAGGRRRRPA